MSDLWSKILPDIFGSIPQIASRLKADFDRSEFQEFDALLKPESELARKKYTKYVPVLFPNHQTDMSMLFHVTRASIGKHHCLNVARRLCSPSTKALKGLLQGAASISRNKTYAKLKKYAKLWKLLSITEGGIATIVILVNINFDSKS